MYQNNNSIWKIILLIAIIIGASILLKLFGSVVGFMLGNILPFVCLIILILLIFKNRR